MAANTVVRTNIFSLNAHRNLKNTGLEQRRSANRLSSGYRINSAADDAAGLAISENMRAQIRGLNQASVNSNHAQSLIQTAEGAMDSISEMLIRVRELMIQAANDTNTLEQRAMIQFEVENLLREINDTARRAEFNSIPLLNAGSRGVDFSAEQWMTDNRWMIAGPAMTIGMRVPDGEPPNQRGENSLRHQLGEYRSEWMEFYNEIPERIPFYLLVEEANQFRDIVGRVSDLMEAGNNAVNDIINIMDTQLTAFGDTSSIQPEYDAWMNGYIPLRDGITSNMIVLNNLLNIAETGALNFNALPPGALFAFDAFFHNPQTTLVQDRLEQLVDLALLPLAAMATDLEDTSHHLFFQTGANGNQGMNLTIKGMSTRVLGQPYGDLGGLINVVHPNGQVISNQVHHIDRALDTVNKARSRLGAAQNRLDYTMRSLDISSENLQDSESRIRNTDMAREMMNFTKSNILQQAGISMLSMANQMPNLVLTLLD